MKKPIPLKKGWKCPRCHVDYFDMDGYTQHQVNHKWHDKHLKAGMLVYVRAGGHLEVITQKAIDDCYFQTGQIADVLNKTDISRLMEIAPETCDAAPRARGMVMPSGNLFWLWSNKNKGEWKRPPLTKEELRKFWMLAPDFHIQLDAVGRLKTFPRNFYDVVGDQ
jgi:hypothetical protein